MSFGLKDLKVKRTNLFFMRGNQMIVHDPRLNIPGNPNATPPRPPQMLKPPPAKQIWTVNVNDTADHITGWSAKVARDWGKMTALHFMAHGTPDKMHIGTDGFSMQNVHLFERYKGYVKVIIFFSCLIGENFGNAAVCGASSLNFGQQVAVKSGAKVVACNELQWYSWNQEKTINFGEFEGDSYVFHPDGCTFEIFNSHRRQPLDLEKLIFGFSSPLRGW